MFSQVIYLSLVSLCVAAQPPGVISPVAKICNSSLPKAVCINNYGAVLSYPFFRDVSTGGLDIPYSQTNVPNDTSFSLLASADFLVFDQTKGLQVLGENAKYEFMFALDEVVHEAPVYSPVNNKLYFSQLQEGIYWAASGGNNSTEDSTSTPAIIKMDPTSNKATVLLNNYFGRYFNTIDDLFIDESGVIFFTDPDYSWFQGLDNTAPMLEAASYRFDPNTGSVVIIDDSMDQPNGIALAPLPANSGTPRTVYVSDSGVAAQTIVQDLGSHGFTYNTTGKRTVYAYDLSSNGKHLLNRRPIYLAQEWGPDGLKVAANGYIVTATGSGVDVVDPDGDLLLRVQTNFTVQNIAWAGSNFEDLWMVGIGGAARVQGWNLPGQQLV
ncbi:hypothetical protein B7463_g8599, partial [Scytalidium lignicola]